MSKESRHWDRVYQNHTPDAVSWYAPHLERSLQLITELAPSGAEAIIDVGGGESTLIDDLLQHGYTDLSVLDISSHALEVVRARLGSAGAHVNWLASNILDAPLPSQRYAIWHDRAIFHFLTTPAQRAAYIQQVLHAVRPGGYIIVATFGPQGPLSCSGLGVKRYDADALQQQFGSAFKPIGSFTEQHRTPFGKEQQFLYCCCQLEKSRQTT